MTLVQFRDTNQLRLPLGQTALGTACHLRFRDTDQLRLVLGQYCALRCEHSNVDTNSYATLLSTSNGAV